MATRKVQSEIERTFKKVFEGIEYFNEVIDKLYNATTNNQKDKYEIELKKEIKKLQRYRDQIKLWQTATDIKDKTQLNEVRRQIEVQMERFKTCEKEMKTKAYSKEGLSQSTKLDPEEQQKLEMSAWFSQSVYTLGTQIEALEAELELLVLAKKAKKGDKEKDVLQVRINKHKGHVEKIEKLLRMFENDQVSLDELASLKDGIEYYIESYQEPDFVEDETLFDDFDLLSVADSDSEQSAAEDETKPMAAPPTSPSPPQPPKPVVHSPKPMMAQPAPVPVPAAAPHTAVHSHVQKKEVHIVSPPPALVPPTPIVVAQEPKRREEPSFSEILSGIKDVNINAPQKMGEQRPLLESLRLMVESLKAKTMAEGRMNEEAYLQRGLENSFVNIPDSADLDRQRYVPKSPFPVPNYYPTNPPAIFENPTIFERFDVDTLFFIFYYQQRTLQQYFSARELKKQSWRFHKKYLTWFQRHEEPKIITDEYEQGTYIYFDYEGSWCQRKKTEFTFEYRYLEDAELL